MIQYLFTNVGKQRIGRLVMFQMSSLGYTRDNVSCTLTTLEHSIYYSKEIRATRLEYLAEGSDILANAEQFWIWRAFFMQDIVFFSLSVSTCLRFCDLQRHLGIKNVCTWRDVYQWRPYTCWWGFVIPMKLENKTHVVVVVCVCVFVYSPADACQ